MDPIYQEEFAFLHLVAEQLVVCCGVAIAVVALGFVLIVICMYWALVEHAKQFEYLKSTQSEQLEQAERMIALHGRQHNLRGRVVHVRA